MFSSSQIHMLWAKNDLYCLDEMLEGHNCNISDQGIRSEVLRLPSIQTLCLIKCHTWLANLSSPDTEPLVEDIVGVILRLEPSQSSSTGVIHILITFITKREIDISTTSQLAHVHFMKYLRSIPWITIRGSQKISCFRAEGIGLRV